MTIIGWLFIIGGLVATFVTSYFARIYWTLVGLAVLAVFIALFIVMLTKSAKRARDVVLPWWGRSVGLWGKLFYCERCDMVYNPGRPDEDVHVSRIHDYLVSRVEQKP